MPKQEHYVEDLTATIKRIADSADYIVRMERLIELAAERGEDTTEAADYLADMRVLQVTFQRNRDTLMHLIGEGARVAALQALNIMDSPEERAYDDIAWLASSICGTPIALVSLVDGQRQWFKARVGLGPRETPRELAFCAHAIENATEVMVVRDAQSDPRFADNALVTGNPNIRFYAGAPLVTSSGHALGTLCVIDTRPRDIEPAQIEELRMLAGQVVAILESRDKDKGNHYFGG